MTKETSQKVFFVPEAEVEGKYTIIRLKHPKSSSAVLCALDSSNKLHEIVHFTEEFSSWFVEDSVIEDGRIFLMTIVDPLFFILPYVNQDGKFCPLEDLLIDENFPDVHSLLKSCNSDELLNIFDTKDGSADVTKNTRAGAYSSAFSISYPIGKYCDNFHEKALPSNGFPAVVTILEMRKQISLVKQDLSHPNLTLLCLCITSKESGRMPSSLPCSVGVACFRLLTGHGYL
ncbi:ribonuclease H2 subunit B [Trichonephila clavipes]|nr:ribonuclease H2 subunit B [Trichonephila clavipes]